MLIHNIWFLLWIRPLYLCVNIMNIKIRFEVRFTFHPKDGYLWCFERTHLLIYEAEPSFDHCFVNNYIRYSFFFKIEWFRNKHKFTQHFSFVLLVRHASFPSSRLNKTSMRCKQNGGQPNCRVRNRKWFYYREKNDFGLSLMPTCKWK